MTELFLNQAGHGKQAQCCATAAVVLLPAQEVPLHSNVLPGAILHGRMGRNTHAAQVTLCLH